MSAQITNDQELQQYPKSGYYAPPNTPILGPETERLDHFYEISKGLFALKRGGEDKMDELSLDGDVDTEGDHKMKK